MSLTKEDLQAIATLLEPINNRLDTIENDITTIKADITDIKADIAMIKSDIEDIKEYAEITRVSANASTEWLRKWSGKDKPFPVENDSFDDDEDIM